MVKVCKSTQWKNPNSRVFFQRGFHQFPATGTLLKRARSAPWWWQRAHWLERPAVGSELGAWEQSAEATAPAHGRNSSRSAAAPVVFPTSCRTGQVSANHTPGRSRLKPCASLPLSLFQIVCYIYFTRIIAILLRVTMPFQWQWCYEVRRHACRLSRHFSIITLKAMEDQRCQN